MSESKARTVHLVVGTMARFQDWSREHLRCSGVRAQADHRAFPLADVPSYHGTYLTLTRMTQDGPVAVEVHMNTGSIRPRQFQAVQDLLHDLRLAGIPVAMDRG